MHYFIDGYNLLFRTSWQAFHSNLEEARKSLIQEIDTYSGILHYTITIVFDAPLQTEDLTRSHFRNLEIIFTARGVTADEYLIDLFSHASSTSNYTLVTSDRHLSLRARQLHVKTVKSEDFISKLRKSSHKKMILKKDLTRQNERKSAVEIETTKKLPAKNVEALTSHQPRTQISEVDLQQKQENTSSKKTEYLPPLGDLASWERIFEERIVEIEKKKKGRK